MKVCGRSIAAGALALFSVSNAQTESFSSTAGDIEYGEYLSSECVTCHQPSGVDKGIPSITGWKESKFVAVLKAYRERRLPNKVMRNIANNLDDYQMESLAAFFATLTQPNL